MYLRHTTVTKNGKSHTYWRLVRSVRVGSKVRQETVAQLGELDARGRIAARHLASSLVGLKHSLACSMTRFPPSRSPSITVGCGWNAADGLATSGSAGGSGRRWDSTDGSRSVYHVAGKTYPGTSWRPCW